MIECFPFVDQVKRMKIANGDSMKQLAVELRGLFSINRSPLKGDTLPSAGYPYLMKFYDCYLDSIHEGIHHLSFDIVVTSILFIFCK